MRPESQPPSEMPSMFRIDVSPTPEAPPSNPAPTIHTDAMMVALLRQLIGSQHRTNQLLEELVQQVGSAQKQRAQELGQWRDANPALARSCRSAAETLSRVQTQFLDNLTQEVMENEEVLVDGEFMLSEFVDRFGPRLAHLNGVLQVLSQLSSVPAPANS